MTKKLYFLLIAIFAILGVAVLQGSISAKNDDNYALPETEGVYDVPGRPDLKLKVFVYRGKDDVLEKAAKPGNPAPQPPVETCKSTSIADPDSSSVVKSAGWKLPSTWNYQVNLSSVPATIGTVNAQTLITNAFNTWTGAVGPKVVFSQTGTTSVTNARFDYQNIVTWGRTSGSALAVTYTWYNPSTGYATEIDTIMNKKFIWYWSDPASWATGETCAYSGAYDAQAILTHELGHTLGLDDHYTSEYANNTMYGYGSKGETKKDTLTIGDIAGAKAIYQTQ